MVASGHNMIRSVKKQVTSGHKVVDDVSQSGHKVVTPQNQIWNKVLTKFSHTGHTMVPMWSSVGANHQSTTNLVTSRLQLLL